MARKYKLEHPDEQRSSLEQIVAVNVVRIIPDEIYQFYMAHIEQRQLKAFFKQEARKVHPDKNPHQSAAKAFQKLASIYKNVCQKRQIH